MLIASGTEMLRICAHREQYRNLMASILEIQITISADAQQQYKQKKLQNTYQYAVTIFLLVGVSR